MGTTRDCKNKLKADYFFLMKSMILRLEFLNFFRILIQFWDNIWGTFESGSLMSSALQKHVTSHGRHCTCVWLCQSPLQPRLAGQLPPFVLHSSFQSFGFYKTGLFFIKDLNFKTQEMDLDGKCVGIQLSNQYPLKKSFFQSL